MKNKSHHNSKLKKLALVALLFFALLLGFFFVYASNFYSASEEALQIIQDNNALLIQTKEYISCGNPSTAKIGYIFYPGGKVDSAAYIPYLMQIAQDEAFLCVVVKPAFHLSVFGKNLADDVKNSYPQIDEWFIGGHSLGGVTAASYALENKDDTAGLILLASYPNNNLSAVDFPILSVTATNDVVLNWENYAAAKSKLPSTIQEHSIDGGNHGQFGSYGKQKNDGLATISPEEQRNITAQASLEFMAA